MTHKIKKKLKAVATSLAWFGIVALLSLIVGGIYCLKRGPWHLDLSRTLVHVNLELIWCDRNHLTHRINNQNVGWTNRRVFWGSGCGHECLYLDGFNRTLFHLQYLSVGYSGLSKIWYHFLSYQRWYLFVSHKWWCWRIMQVVSVMS